MLVGHLEKYRAWDYPMLASAVGRDGGFIDHIEVVASDGTECQLEFNACWDDGPGGDVRVFGDLTAGAAQPLWGFLPIYSPDVIECFIMSSGGSFVGE